MARRKKKRHWWGFRLFAGIWSSLGDGAKRALLMGVVGLSLLVGIGFAAAAGIDHLQESTYASIGEKYPAASWDLIDWPTVLPEAARADIEHAIVATTGSDWMGDGTCRRLADRLVASGWVEQVRYVRRTSNARFLIDCDYRTPFAMVQQGEAFYWIDRQGVRLPGVYLYDPRWPFIQGVEQSAPEPGQKWAGRDLRAGLATLSALASEQFRDQVSAVLVNNYGGRQDARASHIELATDRMGGRIHWGSAPGEEVEENSVAEKVAILRENYRQTGRIDADHQVIDITTFANSYTVAQ